MSIIISLCAEKISTFSFAQVSKPNVGKILNKGKILKTHPVGQFTPVSSIKRRAFYLHLVNITKQKLRKIIRLAAKNFSIRLQRNIKIIIKNYKNM